MYALNNFTHFYQIQQNVENAFSMLNVKEDEIYLLKTVIGEKVLILIKFTNAKRNQLVKEVSI